MTLGGDASEVVIGGCPAALYIVSDDVPVGENPSGGRVVRLTLGQGFCTEGGAGCSEIIQSTADSFDFFGFDGARLYFDEMCPSTIPEESGGNFVRYVDTRSGQMGLLADLPGYPFVTAPTGFAHDPTGTTLYYLQ